MMLASLIDLGVPISDLQSIIDKLDIKAKLEIDTVINHGIRATQLKVIAEKSLPRHLFEINKIISSSSLPNSIIEKAIECFEKLAQTEAHIHGIEMDEVHFHEIGAVDTLIDIVGVLFCLSYLQIDAVYCSALPWCSGFVDIEHGRYPLPAPATAALLRGMPCYGSDAAIELITPTGALLLNKLVKSFGILPAGRIADIGYGAGTFKRHDNVPNLLRSIVIDSTLENPITENIVLLETQIDDMNPELLSYICSQILELEGVHEVFLTPILMKKGRSGSLLSVICTPESSDHSCAYILNNSTSLGIRKTLQTRQLLKREVKPFATPWGTVMLKIAFLPNGSQRMKPEFEDCQVLASNTGITISEIYDYIAKHWSSSC